MVLRQEPTIWAFSGRRMVSFGVYGLILRENMGQFLIILKKVNWLEMIHFKYRR